MKIVTNNLGTKEATVEWRGNQYLFPAYVLAELDPEKADHWNYYYYSTNKELIELLSPHMHELSAYKIYKP